MMPLQQLHGPQSSSTLEKELALLVHRASVDYIGEIKDMLSSAIQHLQEATGDLIPAGTFS